MSIIIAKNPNTPFISTILNLQPGQIIRVLGMIAPGGKRMAVNLQRCYKYSVEDDVPLHIDFRPKEGNCIVRNSFEKNNWKTEERDGSCPIKIGEFFELLILICSDRFKLAINGAHFCEFAFRLPLNAAKYLHIYHDSKITTVSLEKQDISIVKYPVMETIYKMFPMITSLGAGGCFVGKELLIHGKATLNAERININLQNNDFKDPEKAHNSLIAFHMSIRFDLIQENAGVIVFNTFKGHWFTEERQYKFPFSRNTIYNIRIFCEQNQFNICINNILLCNFKYRAPLSECKYLYICGDTSIKYVN